MSEESLHSPGEGIVDRGDADAMELDDPGFHHSVLADFRARLTEDDRADDASVVQVRDNH